MHYIIRIQHATVQSSALFLYHIPLLFVTPIIVFDSQAWSSYFALFRGM